MPQRALVGFGHKKGVGKDTAARMLAEDRGWKVVAFADPLKEACGVVFGWDKVHLYGSLKDVVDPYWGFTPGHALQRVGTEAFRGVMGEDIWVRALFRRLDMEPGYVRGFVVTDVRFPNEADAIRARGGRVIRVDRTLPTLHQTAGRSPNHASETALDGYTRWDAVLDNNGRLDDLHGKLGDVLSHLDL